MSRPARARVKVLDAAERVLRDRSAASFTLEAVAVEAGVSKGGLMYHFVSKEALLQALVARAVLAVDEALEAVAADAGGPGAFTRAYLDVTIPPSPAAGREAVTNSVGQPSGNPGAVPVAALAAAVALDPQLLAPLREAYDRWQRRLENDGLSTAAATTVRLAVDGWWLAALLHLSPLSAEVHLSTRELLERLASPPPTS